MAARLPTIRCRHLIEDKRAPPPLARPPVEHVVRNAYTFGIDTLTHRVLCLKGVYAPGEEDLDGGVDDVDDGDGYKEDDPSSEDEDDDDEADGEEFDKYQRAKARDAEKRQRQKRAARENGRSAQEEREALAKIEQEELHTQMRIAAYKRNGIEPPQMGLAPPPAAPAPPPPDGTGPPSTPIVVGDMAAMKPPTDVDVDSDDSASPLSSAAEEEVARDDMLVDDPMMAAAVAATQAPTENRGRKRQAPKHYVQDMRERKRARKAQGKKVSASDFEDDDEDDGEDEEEDDSEAPVRNVACERRLTAYVCYDSHRDREITRLLNAANYHYDRTARHMRQDVYICVMLYLAGYRDPAFTAAAFGVDRLPDASRLPVVWFKVNCGDQMQYPPGYTIQDIVLSPVPRLSTTIAHRSPPLTS